MAHPKTQTPKQKPLSAPAEQPKAPAEQPKLSELSNNTINFFIKAGHSKEQVKRILIESPDDILDESEFASAQVGYVIDKLKEQDDSRLKELEKIVASHETLEAEMGKLSYNKRAMVREKGLPHYKKLEEELEAKIYPVADQLEAEGLVYPYKVAPLNIDKALAEYKILSKSESDAKGARDNAQAVEKILNTVDLDVSISKFKISQIPPVTFLMENEVSSEVIREFITNFAIHAKGGGGSKGGGSKGKSLSHTIHTTGGSFKNTPTGVFCPIDWFQAQSATLKTGFQAEFDTAKTKRIEELEKIMKANEPIPAEEATEMAKKDAVKFITLAGVRTRTSADAQEILTGILKGTVAVIPASMNTQVFSTKEDLLVVYPEK